MGAMALAHVVEQWTADDLAQIPDDGLRYEIIDGVLLVSPAPLRRHQVALGQLYLLLTAACPPQYEAIMAPADWKIDNTTVVQPDLMVVPLAGVDEPIATPVLAVEIASRSTARVDRTLKFGRYAEAGAAQYWIVNPGSTRAAPWVEVYDLAHGHYVLQGRADGDDVLRVSGPVPLSFSPAALIRR